MVTLGSVLCSAHSAESIAFRVPLISVHVPPVMARFSFRTRSGRHHHNRVLLLIAFYKFLHALLFFAIGIGAHHLLHKDIADQIEILARHFRFDPESRLVNFLLEKASLLNDPMLRRIGFVAYCYAAVTLLEGIGLYLEKTWAEILTLVITASFLPWELFEIFRRITWFRVGLFTINVLVVFYLIRIVVLRARQRARSHKT